MSKPSVDTVYPMEIDQIRELIADDMRAVDQLIHDRLSSDVVLINQLSQYIINSGGKRLRPMLVLLASRAFEYSGDQHINLAAVVEFIHTATLLHDDVVDASELRRGQETANALWGNEASVLVGDFLYSRAFQMMVDADSMRVMTVLADATNIIAEGEVMQLMNCNDPDTTELKYLEVIRCKTAKLFEAAARLGSILGGGTPEQESAIADYGMHLGTAFQLVDDALDYSATSAEIGKNIGDDLAEGKPTLPLIYAMRKGSADQVTLIRNAIESGGREAIDEILRAIESTQAIEYTAELAKAEADLAVTRLDGLPDTPYKQALASLAVFSVNRTY